MFYLKIKYQMTITQDFSEIERVVKSSEEVEILDVSIGPSLFEETFSITKTYVHRTL